jgi:DnaJ-class molecular chaperone
MKLSHVRVSCDQCYGTGMAGMLSPTRRDLVYRQDTSCSDCSGRGYVGKPSLRRRLYEWLSAPEKLSKL